MLREAVNVNPLNIASKHSKWSLLNECSNSYGIC
jgi:hypothetical protein